MITNKHNIALSVALMLVDDTYDHDYRSNAISATGLLKPLRMLALSAKHKDKLQVDIDVTDLVASVTGTAVHTALENVWLNPDKVKRGLAKLGFNKAKVLVNPSDDDIKSNPDHSVVYVEKRSELKVVIDGVEYILTGKFDMVLEGKLEDLKNTGSFKVIKTLKEMNDYQNIQFKTLDEHLVVSQTEMYCPSVFEYVIQGSIYKLLNPKIITEDFMSLQYIIKDFMKYKVGQDFYPDVNPYQLDLELFSKEATLAWVKSRLTRLKSIIETDQIPLCTDTDLWRNPALFKVYKDIKSKRALPKGTFETQHEAVEFNSKRKVQGDIRVIPSVPKRCNWCSVKPVCSQYDKFIKDGLIKEEL